MCDGRKSGGLMKNVYMARAIILVAMLGLECIFSGVGEGVAELGRAMLLALALPNQWQIVFFRYILQARLEN
jgi:hypothetical protein